MSGPLYNANGPKVRVTPGKLFIDGHEIRGVRSVDWHVAVGDVASLTIEIFPSEVEQVLEPAELDGTDQLEIVRELRESGSW